MFQFLFRLLELFSANTPKKTDRVPYGTVSHSQARHSLFIGQGGILRSTNRR